MAYVNVYSSRINWENEPNISTPLNATNLNKMDYALHEIDSTLATWDTTKADESDLLLCVKSITYDTNTGEFVFTWQNGTTYTVDLNIEKIPVAFSMDGNGVITMTTEDGSTYTADVGSLIKTYSFSDSSEIDFTVTTDANGNKTVTAGIVAGSIDGTKLVPNYLADCQSAKTDAETAEGKAEDSAEDAEAWAVGERNGVPVTSGDETYENNAKYWAQQANPTSLSSLTDVTLTSPTNGQGLVYDSNSTSWKNKKIVDASAVHWEDYGKKEDATISNGIASFNSFEKATIEGLVIDIDPVQDLHGYDKPWAGGAGKNLVDIPSRTVSSGMSTDKIRTEGCSATKDGDVITVVNSGAWSKLWIQIDTNILTDGQTYTLSANFTNASGATIGLATYVNSAWKTPVTSNDTTATMSLSYTHDSSVTTLALGILTNNTGTSDTSTVVIDNIQFESGSSATTYEPYSNICPISGHTEAKVTQVDDVDNPTVTNTFIIDLNGTIYGGSLNVTTGELTVDSANIASYAGETIHEPWISSMDEYVSGATPTTGAQVVYTLATPTTVQLTAQEVVALLGTNNIFADTGDVTYCSHYVLGGDQPMACNLTTAGTYTLSATVDSDGNVTYKWA